MALGMVGVIHMNRMHFMAFPLEKEHHHRRVKAAR
jgi:hypothetical protein